MNTNMEISIGGRKMVLASDIIYLQADQNYTRIYLKNGNQEYVATTLGILERRLSELGFVRPNRKVVINPSFISSIANDRVILKNQGVFKISRRRNITF